MNSWVKSSLIGLGIGLGFSGIMWTSIFYNSKPKIDRNGRVIQPPPPQYPFVDQVKMELVLKSGEHFICINHTNPGYFVLVTQVEKQPVDSKEFRVYTGLMGDRGVMIEQPSLWYTIKEQ